MTQRITIEGEEWELYLKMLQDIPEDHTYAKFSFIKVAPQKEEKKESEKAWDSYDSELRCQGLSAIAACRQLQLSRRLADAIKAEILEELEASKQSRKDYYRQG